MKFHGFLVTITLVIILTTLVYGQYEVDLSSDVPANYQSTGVIPTRMIESSGIIRGGMEITAQGILKVPIVFVRFAGDNAISPGGLWSDPNVLPTQFANLLDQSIPIGNIYTNNNLSKYYDLFSGGNGLGVAGEFQVIGDVFYVTVSKSYNQYSTDGEIAEEVINILDGLIDFRQYDNWRFKVNNEFYNHQYVPFNPKTGTSADGKLDCMVIFSRLGTKTPNDDVGGIASLGGIGTLIKDGITINNRCGVTGFNAHKRWPENIMAIISHELGHYQFGMIGGNDGSHFDGRYLTDTSYNYGNLHSFSLMTRYGCHHFNAYEKYRLGWLDPQIITSNMSYVELNETFLGSNNNSILIPVRYDNDGKLKEFFLLENYHSTDAYSSANPFLITQLFGNEHVFTKGVLAYHIAEENFTYPTMSDVDMECADGKWDWQVIQGGSTPLDRLDDLIDRVEPNENDGQDERDYIRAMAGNQYYNNYMALTPSTTYEIEKKKQRRYSTNDQLGDMDDFFNLGYNTVFTNWSNPSTRKRDNTQSEVGFEIVGYNNRTKKFILSVATNASGIIALSPSKPQNLTISKSGSNHPLLNWPANGESDLARYNVYKKTTSAQGWNLYISVTTNSYEDVNETYLASGGIGYEHPVYYYVTAFDTQSKESNPSKEVTTLVKGALLEKEGIDALISKVPVEFGLFQNHPNPFNPETVIRFTLPEAGFAKGVVYDILGREVSILLDGETPAGQHHLKFNAEGLGSGVYFFRLNAGKYSATIKMTLNK